MPSLHHARAHQESVRSLRAPTVSAAGAFLLGPAVRLAAAARRIFGRRTIDQLVECALFAVGLMVLVQETKLTLVKDIEELVPRHLLKRFRSCAAGKIDAQQAAVAF